MAPRPRKGVGGVLSNLITEPREPAPAQDQEGPKQAQPAPRTEAARGEEPRPARSREASPAREAPPRGLKKEARRGRPPGRARTSEPVEREKVSLRLRADLAAAYPKVLRVCTALAGNRGIAEDLAQDTMLEALRLQHRIYAVDGVERWLAAIARNIWFRWRRQQRRESWRLLAAPIDAAQCVHRQCLA